MSQSQSQSKSKNQSQGQSAYVIPSQRKTKVVVQTIDEMFPEGLVPVTNVKKAAMWSGNFKAAIEKADVSDDLVTNEILYSSTNRYTGITTVVRDMPIHPDDLKGASANIIIPNIPIKKLVKQKQRVLDEEDESHVEEQSHVEDDNFDSYSEHDLEDCVDTVEDYISD